ncbi:MAG: MarR family winged helix-turn-helix transcriptional regulator [Candidatus Binatia bacterium]
MSEDHGSRAARPHVASDILRALRRVLYGITLHSKQLARESGLTLPQLAVLRALRARNPPEATVLDVARDIGVGSPTVTGIADRLERLSMLERIRSTSDRRKVYVRLTELGASRVQSVPEQPQDRFVKGMMALAPSARDTLLTSLEQIELELMEAPPDFEPAPVLVADEKLHSEES